jgi:AcrR family transcriptional regulator
MTRAAILHAALGLARLQGLEGLTIGVLAQHAQMSKSGVFAHFGSREELQVAVLREYQDQFIQSVLKPAVQQPRGMPRLEAILTHWLSLILQATGGCLWLASASEYDDYPGVVRDTLVDMVRGWQQELDTALQQAQATGELAGNMDRTQLVAELYGVMLMAQYQGRLLHPAATTENPHPIEATVRRAWRQVLRAPRVDAPG